MILVTGGCGFIGSHIVEKLVENGYNVSIISRPRCNHENIRHLLSKIKFYNGDVTDIKFLENTMRNMNSLECIVHLAALINVDESIKTPRLFWDVNVGGTFNVLECARKKDAKVIKMSTCEVYGNVPKGKADEKHPTNPCSPYAASKLAADRYCFTYHNTYGLPVTIARPFNIYGPRQSAAMYGAVIPKFITRVLNNQPPLIFGDGLQTRDYVYVEDVAEGYLKLIKNNNFPGEAINFATGIDHSIGDIANRVIKFAGKEDILRPEFVNARQGELRRSCGDYSKAKKLLGWEPKVSFDEGLKKTIAFFKANSS